MAIPRGYRLLTKDDVDKVFGVDLESVVYFDTSVTLTGNESYFAPDMETPISEGLLYTFGGSNAVITLNNYGMTELVWEASSGWIVSNLDMGTDVNTVGNFNDFIAENWNTWFYVREIGWVDTYDIKIKNKEGIKLLTKDKLLTDDVKVTIDESLLGGGSSGGVTKPTITLDFMLYKSGIVYYMVDDGAYKSVNASQTINVVGNIVTIYSPNGVEINQFEFAEDENAFVRDFSPTGLSGTVYILYATKDVKLDIFRFDYDAM